MAPGPCLGQLTQTAEEGTRVPVSTWGWGCPGLPEWLSLADLGHRAGRRERQRQIVTEEGTETQRAQPQPGNEKPGQGEGEKTEDQAMMRKRMEGEGGEAWLRGVGGAHCSERGRAQAGPEEGAGGGGACAWMVEAWGRSAGPRPVPRRERAPPVGGCCGFCPRRGADPAGFRGPCFLPVTRRHGELQVRPYLWAPDQMSQSWEGIRANLAPFEGSWAQEAGVWGLLETLPAVGSRQSRPCPSRGIRFLLG